MSQSYILNRPQIWPLLTEQIESMHQKKTLKLNSITTKIPLADLVEGIHEFLNSYSPPLELERLSLQNNQIIELPANITSIAAHMKYLDLHQNHLSHISKNIIKEFESLEILDLSSNRLYTLPSSLNQLQHLKIISIGDNRFKYLPPVLCELRALNLLEVADNPLVLPAQELIKSFQNQHSESDWIEELKSYLHANKSLLEFKIHEQQQQMQQQQSSQNGSKPNLYPPPQLPSAAPPILRSKSTSETKSKASKAARRMGLIIKKSEEKAAASNGTTLENGNHSGTSTANTTLEDSTNNSSVFSPASDFVNTDYSSTLNLPHSASAAQTTFNVVTPPLPTASAVTATNSNASTLSRSSSRNRTRSNTLKEIDKILEKNENVDTEHKSGAYFRRLSTLQENPSDERDGILQQHQEILQRQTLAPRHDDTSSKSLPATTAATSRPAPAIVASDISPSRGHNGGNGTSNSIGTGNVNKYTSSTIVKVSRKILFSFSELHSSVRRFTGFCADKKITIKMVSLLYTTKSNIDLLVENLEVMEETGSNMDQITSSLHVCINSFKSIMNLLSENFSTFVVKIDVCFIRMLYLTLFGSFNELLNAYRILVPPTKQSKFNVPTLPSNAVDSKQKLSVNTSLILEKTSEVDEKLYVTIDSATTNASNIFSELSKAINKSALASATSANPVINANVANKVKELTNVCMSSMDITKRLKTKLITIRNNPSQTSKKAFGEDINLFIKAMVQTLASVKGLVKDLPILDDIRASMSNLTKTAKEVTYMLELSSYRLLATDAAANGSSQHPPPLVTIPSVSNLFPQSSHPSLQNHSLSSANLAQLSSNTGQGHTNSLTPIRTPLTATPLVSPVNTNFHGPMTVPAQSTGQYYAKNGLNPFDGLIMAYNDGEKGEEE
ncbi:RAM signaling pathway protein-domain-containing protein [Scheffersomyces xylosifermentans]|uniref:RAM signaling pathway protein-domain-containing protein n=1 Tax=Scheffersomyces xylosifermentans TaxID=1304137 RepID=UPI00315CF797